MRGKIIKEYDYHDAAGELAHQTLRYEPKDFRQRRKPVAGDAADDVCKDGWIWSLGGAELFPYRLPEILRRKGEVIFLVEGEKDADALAEVGALATTLPMGCGKWRDDYAKWFRGRRVVVIADNDEAGVEGAEKVALALFDIVAQVRVLKMPMLWPAAPDKGDVSDWIADWIDGGGYDFQIMELLHEAAAKNETRLPLDVVMLGVAEAQGNKIALDELAFSERLVKWLDVLFCGGRFWRYFPKDGVWRPEPIKQFLEKEIKLGLEVSGAGGLGTSSRVASLLKLMESERAILTEQLNRQPVGWVCFKNGVYDTINGDFKPHRADWLMTNAIPHAWNPGAPCVTWMEWLKDRVDGDDETLEQIQEMFGYCLSVDLNFHVFFMLYGDGGTGKSTLVNVLEAMVGEENRVALQLEELDNAFMRSRLVGKQLYLCKELTDKSFQHIGLLKALVSGDVISVDVKNKDGFDFKPYGKVVMESNVVAMTPDSSGGFARRFVQIDFDKPVPRDAQNFNLTAELVAEIEGILAWSMIGLQRLRKRNFFKTTEKSEAARAEVLKHRGQIMSFWNAGWIEESNEGYVETARIHHLYKEWCDEVDVVPFYDAYERFMREFMGRNKHLRPRKKRKVINGTRAWVIEGVQVAAGVGDADEVVEF